MSRLVAEKTSVLQGRKNIRAGHTTLLFTLFPAALLFFSDLELSLVGVYVSLHISCSNTSSSQASWSR